MPKFRADFEVKSTLALSLESPSQVIRGRDPDCEISINNGPLDKSGHVPYLNIRVVSNSDSIENVAEEFREVLAKKLDVLSFVTQSSFIIQQCTRVIDWEPFQKSRSLRVLQKFEALYPPSLDLSSDCIRTAEHLSSTQIPEYVQNALKYFRLGVLLSQPEEQFTQFWLAIETIAEGRKDRSKVPVKCSNCDTDLVCSSCHVGLTRSPYTAQAMRDLFSVVVLSDANKIYKKLSTVRHRLLHGGGSLRDTISATGNTFPELIDISGNIAWSAIMADMPKIEEPLYLGHRDGQFVNMSIIAGPIMTFDNNSEYPSDDQIPAVQIELITSFRES